MKWASLAIVVVSFAVVSSPVAMAKEPAAGFDVGRYVVPGEHISTAQTVSGHPRALRRSGPVWAYLDNVDDARINHGWPSPPLRGGQTLGEVQVVPAERHGSAATKAILDFSVSDVPAGLYEIRACITGCARDIGALGSAFLYVVSNTLERRLRNEIDEMYRELSDWENRVVRLHGRVLRLPRPGSRLDAHARALTGLRDDVRSLERTAARLEERVFMWLRLGLGAVAVLGLALGAKSAVGVSLARRESEGTQ